MKTLWMQRRWLTMYSALFLLVAALGYGTMLRSGHAMLWKLDGVGQYWPTFVYIGRYFQRFVLGLLHGQWLLPGNRDHEQPMSNNALLFALYRMGFKGEMTGHGFRGVASTALHEAGFQHEHIELQLAHQRRNRVSAAYDWAQYLPQRAEMMQWWADWLDERRGEPLRV